MKEHYYEIFVTPDSGPCTVHERGFNNEICFVNKEDAIETAKKKKTLYSNLDFLVHEVSQDRSRAVVFNTKIKV